MYYDNDLSNKNVYLGGYYETLIEAKKRLNFLIPNYVKHYKNTVRNTSRVGWINECIFGDCNFNGLGCDQPNNSINLFE